jgi:hypothetical protein
MSFPIKSRGHSRSGLPVALILGGIELVRPLALAGIRCQVVSGPRDATRFSRHAVTVFPVDWSDPVSSHGPELVERLVRHGAGQPQPPVLFYYWDEPLLFVSRHREERSPPRRPGVAPHRGRGTTAARERIAGWPEAAPPAGRSPLPGRPRSAAGEPGCASSPSTRSREPRFALCAPLAYGTTSYPHAGVDYHLGIICSMDRTGDASHPWRVL